MLNNNILETLLHKSLSEKNEKYNAVILAAGLSERMGTPKFMLNFDDTRTFLDKIIETFLDFGCDQIVVTMNSSGIKFIEEKNISYPEIVQIVLNPNPEFERFYSIKTGLKSLSKQQNTFIQNIDNPFVNKKILRILSKSLMQNNYCVPVHEDKGGHPVLLSKNIVINLITEKSHKLNFREFLKSYSKNKVETADKRIFANINTEEEYKSYFKNPIKELLL